jgi:hypothetical protein
MPDTLLPSVKKVLLWSATCCMFLRNSLINPIVAEGLLRRQHGVAINDPYVSSSR